MSKSKSSHRVFSREFKVGIVGRMLAEARNGAILCLHDGREVQEKPDVTPMLEAVKRIVPVLKDRGYSFEVISDLLHP